VVYLPLVKGIQLYSVVGGSEEHWGEHLELIGVDEEIQNRAWLSLVAVTITFTSALGLARRPDIHLNPKLYPPRVVGMCVWENEGSAALRGARWT